MALISRFRPRTLRWRVYSLVGIMLCLLVGTVVATLTARHHASDIGGHVRDQLRPAQVAIAAMSKGYVDMESGLRGYLLTRNERLLGPYDQGRASIERTERVISDRLADDPTSIGLLADVDAAGNAWISTSARPLIDAARAGTLTPQVQANSTIAGNLLFDNLREDLDALQDRTDRLIAAGLQSSANAQAAANTIAIVCAGVAVLVGLILILLLHMSLVRPVNRLVASVGRVSAGDLDQHVTADGPTEVVALGSAVESMRRRIHAESATAAEQSERAARLEEADRIAGDLEQTTIRDLFALSLAVQSVAGRYPAARAALDGVIRDLDRSLAELRTAVLGRMGPPTTRKLRTEVLDLLVLLEQDLAITPELRLAGDHDLTLPGPIAAEVLDVLHDAVFATTGSGSAKEVAISIALSAREVRLSVAGPVPAQARNGARETLDELAERARRHGGTATVQDVADRIAVDWRIPIEPEFSG
ncbi:MAG TPA: CHASE3 domain-containing protein [Actinophytocola sp.]|jgi:CHASE3 domain sensor protein|uniref:CHASE3 domain-containing protein n=1 Tax=Actinophytocola sp. TaxID=1872138 RepID=UPI002F9437DD